MSSAAAVEVPTNTITNKKSCFCYQCKKSFTRSELDSHFLCTICRTIPGVRGYRDPNKRGLDAGSPAYWEHTKHQLNIVGDEPAPTSSASTPPTWSEYQALVRARTDLANGDKVLFERLVAHADHKTGENCAPEIKDLATEIGWTPRLVKKYLHRLTKQFGLVEAVPLRSRRGWAQSLYRFIGHGFKCSINCSKLKYLTPSRMPRIAHDARGRFLGSQGVTRPKRT